MPPPLYRYAIVLPAPAPGATLCSTASETDRQDQAGGGGLQDLAKTDRFAFEAQVQVNRKKHAREMPDIAESQQPPKQPLKF